MCIYMTYTCLKSATHAKQIQLMGREFAQIIHRRDMTRSKRLPRLLLASGMQVAKEHHVLADQAPYSASICLSFACRV